MKGKVCGDFCEFTLDKGHFITGEMFSEENITCKRPGNGISPIHWYEVLGKEAEKDFEIDELISCKGVNREDE